MTAPVDPGPVPTDPGICPPEAPYPATVEARIANDDPTQCLPIDPCGPDGTGTWTAVPCTPPPVPTTEIAAAAPPRLTQLPATGLGSLEVALLVAATIAVAIGTSLRAITARAIRQGNEG